MSNAEHLIENAIVCLKNGENFDFYSGDKVNKNMVASIFPNCDVKYALLQIWEMANEVCYGWFYNETFAERCFGGTE